MSSNHSQAQLDGRHPASFAARHSADSAEWYTPDAFVQSARVVMGGIDLDPASHPEANARLKIDRIYTESDNGLTKDWYGRVFLNPPGGLVADFWKKLVFEYATRAHTDQAIWIGYSLEQFQTLQNIGEACLPQHYANCFPKRRIAFVENEAKRAVRIAKLDPTKVPSKNGSPSHANYITYLGPNIDAFVSEFRQYGIVCP